MLGQVASDAAIVTLRRLLAWANTVTWPVWPVARSFRIEGVNRTDAALLRLWAEEMR
jgi:hypothetical protein